MNLPSGQTFRKQLHLTHDSRMECLLIPQLRDAAVRKFLHKILPLGI